MRYYSLPVLISFLFLLTGATRTLNGGCSFVFGSNDGPALTDLNLGPQGKLCRMPESATLIEISIASDDGTPSIIVQRQRPAGGSVVDLTSSALATGASGALACSRSTASLSIDGTTGCVGTLQNTALQKGDWIQSKANTGGAGGLAKRVSVSVVWTW